IQKRVMKLVQAGGIQSDLSTARNGHELAQLAQSASREKYDLFVAGGGVGTINAVSSAIVDTNKSLGVLPLGTLNHLARDLKIPLDLEAAVRNLIAGNSIKI